MCKLTFSQIRLSLSGSSVLVSMNDVLAPSMYVNFEYNLETVFSLRFVLYSSLGSNEAGESICSQLRGLSVPYRAAHTECNWRETLHTKLSRYYVIDYRSRHSLPSPTLQYCQEGVVFSLFLLKESFASFRQYSVRKQQLSETLQRPATCIAQIEQPLCLALKDLTSGAKQIRLPLKLMFCLFDLEKNINHFKASYKAFYARLAMENNRIFTTLSRRRCIFMYSDCMLTQLPSYRK